MGKNAFICGLFRIFATDMNTESKIHEIDVWIDDFTPCLKDNLTGEVVNTEVIRIRRKSFLSKFNRKSGWYVNWGKIVEEYEVYALVLEGTVDIQGLVALRRNDELKAMYLNFERFAFDTGFSTSFTRRVKASFNFIIFRFVSDNECDCCVHSFTIGYKINRRNKGVF